jgi:hypothetical protein
MGRKLRKGELDAINFDKMPQRCKELFFEFCCTCTLENQGASEIFVEVSGFYIPEECQSPIEQILYFAFEIVSFLRDKDNQPSFYLVPQVEIMANNPDILRTSYLNMSQEKWTWSQPMRFS